MKIIRNADFTYTYGPLTIRKDPSFGLWYIIDGEREICTRTLDRAMSEADKMLSSRQRKEKKS